MERTVTWADIRDAIKDWDRSLKYYGVPRGGQYIAALLNPVDTPEEADVICDDLIDSGKTKKEYEAKYAKPFVAPFVKAGQWLKFPWEKDGSEEIQDNILRVLEYFDDPTREGLKETPKRYIKFMSEFLAPVDFNMTVFDSEGMDEMIVQSNIPFYSLCEHHLAPFYGVAHVAYIPNGKIVGLSKLARTVDLFSRRFQNQERITQQIAEHLEINLNPLGVAVVIKAQHLCVAMRGIKKHDVWTTTSKMTGAFKEDQSCRNEFLNLIT